MRLGTLCLPACRVPYLRLAAGRAAALAAAGQASVDGPQPEGVSVHPR